jgi:hypothetical protein
VCQHEHSTENIILATASLFKYLQRDWILNSTYRGVRPEIPASLTLHQAVTLMSSKAGTCNISRLDTNKTSHVPSILKYIACAYNHCNFAFVVTNNHIHWHVLRCNKNKNFRDRGPNPTRRIHHKPDDDIIFRLMNTLFGYKEIVTAGKL